MFAANDEFKRFTAACNAWQTALERRYGSQAGDMRYSEHGRTGEFADLYAEFRAANDAWLTAIGIERSSRRGFQTHS